MQMRRGRRREGDERRAVAQRRAAAKFRCGRRRGAGALRRDGRLRLRGFRIELADAFNILRGVDFEARRDWRHVLLRTLAEFAEAKAQAGEVVAYTDSLAAPARDSAPDLSATTWSADWWRWPSLGIFFVPKKNGALRMIMDTCAANLWFRRSWTVALPMPRCWSGADVEEYQDLRVVQTDVDNAFHRIVAPEVMPALLCSPEVLAERMGAPGFVAWAGREGVDPVLARFGHGLLVEVMFCQRTVEGSQSRRCAGAAGD